MRFEFATAGRIIFGAGAASQAAALAQELGRRALVVTGRDPSRAAALMKAVNGVAYPVAGEPNLETVRQGVVAARRGQCDFLIGFGGGSALDAAKAIAALMTNDGDVLDYLEVIGGAKPLTRSPAPVLAIPTTAGTGSEVTRNAVLASPGHRVKVSLRHPLMLPRVALVDPALTLNLPPAITASTGLDALTQVIEPYVSPRATPMTDGICQQGIERAARSLRTAFTNGQDAAAREDMCMASLFGGLALANAGLGAVHGFAGVIGGMFDAPHGAICAALLPHVMAANLAALRGRDAANPALPRYEKVGRLLTQQNNATADDGVEWVSRLTSDLKIPRLGHYGLASDCIGDVVEKSRKASSMKANPIVLTTDELSAVLAAAI